MTTNDISYLVFSDVHFGHKKTTTKEIISHLDTFFNGYTRESRFTNLDIIFIAGDLFDSLLDMSSEDIHEITIWLSRLMSFCSRYEIKLRILEGTPSHDWKQSKLAETIYSIVEAERVSNSSYKYFDFRYIDTLHIEYMKDLNIHVLYVPDEWSSTSEQTLKQVKNLMKELNIEQVDIAIMHGLFMHQATWLK